MFMGEDYCLPRKRKENRLDFLQAGEITGAPCPEGGEKGSLPPRADKEDPAYILVRKEKTYIFGADEIKCFLATMRTILMKIHKL